MGQFALRAPSVAALFDEWNPAPLAQRPLDPLVRDRIVDLWLEERKRAPDRQAGPLVLVLPAGDEREGRADAIRTAVRTDMATMAAKAAHQWIRRSVRPRESRVGYVVFVICLLLAAGINYGDFNAWSDTVAQTFVVVAWVALWDPAQLVFDAATRRLARKHYVRIAEIDVQVYWDPDA